MTLVETLAAKLPMRHSIYSAAYANASEAHPNALLTPLEFATIHAALIDREAFTSSGHWALRPPGPGGTGDPTNRWYRDDAVPEAVEPLIESLFTGRSKKDENGRVLLEVRPPKWAGAAVPGWGYGLGQIDFAAPKKFDGVTNKDWLETNDWQDPNQNLNRSASILLNSLLHFQNVRAGIAGYNARFDLVEASFKSTGDPDKFTTGRNYSKDVLAKALNFGFDRELA